MKIKQFIPVVVAALLFSNPLFALQDTAGEDTNKKKLTIDLGFIGIHSTSALDTNGKEKINDNTKEGESSNSAWILPIFDFRYIIGDTKTEVFFGTPTDGSDLSLTLGISQPVDDLGKFKLSFAPSLGTEVWKNPYLENTTRKKTPEYRLTTKVAWENILSSPLNLIYSHIHRDVKDDEIGELYEELERDGYTDLVQLKYNIGLSQTSMVSPGLLLEKSRLEGSANSYDKAGMSVKYQKLNPNFILILEIAVNTASYNEEHPIYNERREDKDAGIFAMVHLPNFFDVEGMHSNIILGTGVLDSNLDFFDYRASYMAVTLGYSY